MAGLERWAQTLGLPREPGPIVSHLPLLLAAWAFWEDDANEATQRLIADILLKYAFGFGVGDNICSIRYLWLGSHL